MFGLADGLAGSQLEEPGTFCTVFRPSINQPALSYAPSQVQNAPTGNPARICMIIDEQTDQVGLWPIGVQGSSSVNSSASTMILQPNSAANIKGQWFWEDQDFSTPPFYGQSGTLDFYGMPLCLSTNDNAPTDSVEVIVSCNSPGDLTNGNDGEHGLYVRAISELGTTSYVLMQPATVGAFTVLVAQIPLGPIVNVLTNEAGTNTDSWVGLPGVGFQLFYNPFLAATDLVQIKDMPLCVNSVQVMSINGAPTINPVTPRFVAFEYEDQILLDEAVDRYRMVSGSLWMENTSSTLTDGGIIGAVSFRGGLSPMELGLCQYPNLSQVPEAYTGSFKLGSYSLWLPANDTDVLFRTVDNAEIYENPFLVACGVYQLGSVASTNPYTGALKVRICSNYEYITTSRFSVTDFSPVAPWKIDHAAVMLRDMPTSMENPLHWAAVKAMLNKAVTTAGDAYNWVVNNRSWLLPAASAIGALVL